MTQKKEIEDAGTKETHKKIEEEGQKRRSIEKRKEVGADPAVGQGHVVEDEVSWAPRGSSALAQVVMTCAEQQPSHSAAMLSGVLRLSPWRETQDVETWLLRPGLMEP